ncbi:MAG TPA: hypothetical protein VD837_06600 [Terriglobales bacterium]|nr:hypothetical protein [Terriglobales bacterium]
MPPLNWTADTDLTSTGDEPAIPADTAVLTPQQAPVWARLVMPSIGDLIFLLTFWFLTFGSWGARLLSDADTGWHIRNGEQILGRHAVPYTDSFSYTMHGSPWYAWEWLYDVVLAIAHKFGGLNGVVVLSALLIALTFTTLFRMASRLCGNVVIAAALTLVAIGASSIHFLARPHLVTWLFVLVWLAALDKFRRDGNWKRLALLPVLMLIWVNLHGGFLLGLVLPVIYATANVWTAVTSSDVQTRRQNWAMARRIGIATLLTSAATLANPYGYKLYVHLSEYLGSSFLMNNISEFLSPDFHFVQVKLFLLLLVVALLAFALTKTSVLDILLVAFSTYAGLYAARNIPISAMLLTLVSAPMLARALDDIRLSDDLSSAIRRVARSTDNFSRRMMALERQLTWQVLPVALVALTLVVCANGGMIGSKQLLDLKFESKRLPVQAAEFLASNKIEAQVFAEDGWGGYLIYRLHPEGFSVFVDDRHDFYGEAFLKDYLKLTKLRRGWSDVLDRHWVNYVLIEPDAALANALRASADWNLMHQDGTAVVFARKVPIAPAMVK